MAGKSKRRTGFGWGGSRTVHVAKPPAGSPKRSPGKIEEAGPEHGARAKSGLPPTPAGKKSLPPLGPRATGSLSPSLGRGGLVSLASKRRASGCSPPVPVYVEKAVEKEPAWNSDVRLGQIGSTFLATKLYEAFTVAGLDPRKVAVEEEWLRIAMDLSEAADMGKQLAASMATRRGARGPPGMAGVRDRVYYGRKEQDTDDTDMTDSDMDMDMDIDSDDAGSSSVASGASSQAQLRRAARKAMAKAAVKELFDYIVVAVMHQLQGKVYEAFQATHFYNVYVRLRHLAYTCQRTLTHDDFDWLGRLGRGGYASAVGCVCCGLWFTCLLHTAMAVCTLRANVILASFMLSSAWTSD